MGFILAGILVLVFLASMLVMSLLFQMHGAEASMAATKGADQAWLAAMSGVEEALRVAGSITPGDLEWRDNPMAFKRRMIYEDGSDTWYFTIYSKADEDSLEPLRYGLVDEASKLNLNIAPREILAKLPGLTTELLDALDRKETGTIESAEIQPDSLPPADPLLEFFEDASTLLSRGYLSLAELLSVKGFNASLVYGEDANFNLRLDPNEDDGNALAPPDNADGKLDLGLAGFLTTYSYDPNIDNKRVRRTDLNDPKDPFPLVELPAAVTNFISALRANHGKLGHPAELLEAKLKVKDEKGVESEIESGVTKAELAQVLDLFTGASEKKQQGLVNVNTAPIKLLATLPGLDEPLAEAIASTRKSISAERRTTIGWLFEEGTLTAEQFKKVAPSLTARSYQFTFHVVGFGLPSGRYRVLEATIDTADKPVVTGLRDLTRYGLPMNLIEESAVSQKLARSGKPASRMNRGGRTRG